MTPMPDGLSITIPGTPPAALGKSSHVHWSVKRREWDVALTVGLVLWMEALTSHPGMPVAQRYPAPLVVSELLNVPWRKVDITITQFWCGRPLDADNLLGRCGAYLDAAQEPTLHRPGAGIIVDDGPDCVQSLTTRYERVRSRDEARVVVTVKPESRVINGFPLWQR